MKYRLLFFMFFVGSVVSAQTDTIPPYKRFPTLPPVQILLTDSTTFYSKAQLPKKTPALFMLFDPACSHCQHETEEMVAKKDAFQNIQVIMITMPRVSFATINEFVDKYKVRELHRVVVGRDVTYFMPSFYSIKNFPFLALYNQNGNLITALEGGTGMSQVIELFKK